VLLYALRCIAQLPATLNDTIASKVEAAISAPLIIPRAEHGMSRDDISKGSLAAVETLTEAGYEAYVVGGGVRDALLGLRPKDFDVATDARPDEIRALFRRCRLIGRRFRLAHVRFGREVVEVATFRGDPGEEDHPERQSVDGRLVRDNVYGTLEEDAWRRDFTVNALYFDPRDESILDFTDGYRDLRERRLRLMGDPPVRYREDPVRTLRALRFVAKLGFELERETERALAEHAALLEHIPPARLFEEVLKLFHGGHALAIFELLRDYLVLERLFPEAAACFEDEPEVLELARRALASTDARIAEGKPVTPAFLFAALLWGPVRHDVAALLAQGVSVAEAWEAAGSDVITRQVQYVALPRRYALVAREIWSLQPRLERHQGKGSLRLLERPRFRAAYDFLVLRAEAGEPVAEHARWWTEVQEAAPEERPRLLEAAPATRKRSRRRRRRRAPAGGNGR